jgi:putative transposase
MVFHVLNRGVGRKTIFGKEQDYAAFEKVLSETHELRPMRICGYCLMPNHWHLLLWPEADGDLGRFMQRLTITHVRRWQEHRGEVGYGHLYQGRYKSFPVEDNDYFYQVARYIERNAFRANLVSRAEDWRWCSFHRRLNLKRSEWLHDWPLPLPRHWLEWVNQPQTEAELESLRQSVNRGRPFGADEWVEQTADRLGLRNTLRAPHRPRKPQKISHAT